MNKLVAVIMAGNCESTIGMCIKSITDKVDEVIVLYDTSSKDDTLHIISDLQKACGTGDTWETFKSKITILHRAYEHDYKIKTANGDARNYYLQYLKQHHMNDWVIVLDADEVMSDNFSIKFLENTKELEDTNCLLLSPRMIHFQQDLGHEDATKDIHYVHNRVFKVHEELYYPSTEHPVLNSKREGVLSGNTESFIIFHLAYCREIKYIKDRYLNHKAKSEIHSEKFLQDWYYLHLFGFYPKRELDKQLIPQVIKDEYLIDDDFFYFMNRNIEVKHFVDVNQWVHFLRVNGQFYSSDDNPTMLFIGDGKGVRTFAARTTGINAKGYDLSEYAVKNNVGNFTKDIYWKQDLLEAPEDWTDEYNLVIAYDILEHLDEKDLSLALANMKVKTLNGGYILISVPMIGDANLLLDKTHKIFWTREQWEDAISKSGFEIEPVPEHFQYAHQLIIGRKK